MEEKKKRSIHDLIKEHSSDKVLDGEQIYDIKLTEITPNINQPRKMFNDESINELANSIKEHGIFQPIIVKSNDDGYMIVSGERRYRAAKSLGMESIPAVIRNYSSSKIAEISLVENLQREDLSAIEEAEAFGIMIKEYDLTQNDVAIRIGKSRSYVTNTLGLLKLPDVIKEMLINKLITTGHAKVLSKLKDEEEMIEIANQIINDNLNVRDLEAITSGKNKTGETKRVNYNKVYKDERNLLSKYYNSKIQIRNDRITFKLENEEDLQKIIESLIKNAL